MNDGIKFIFKTLMRVPVIVCVIYGVFNVFAFSFSYFKLLGFSYVAKQTVIENNYLPEEEKNTLTSYLQTLNTGVLEGCTLIVDTDLSTPNGIDNVRVQYGTPVRVTIRAHYNFIWPLMPSQWKSNGIAAEGMGGQAAGTDLTEEQLNAIRKEYEDNENSYKAQQNNAATRDYYGLQPGEKKKPNIVIAYTVPGLKYYPDLA